MLDKENTLEVINGLRMEGISENVIIAIVMANIRRELSNLMETHNVGRNYPSNIQIGLDYLEAARS